MKSDKREPKVHKARNVPLAYKRNLAHANKKAYKRKSKYDEGWDG